ncbi:MAG: hypothetical protein SGILL_008314 [Bacillariaceae sp.]
MDPVERLWSHYNFIKNLQIKKNKARGPMKTSFEDWVLKDLRRMEKQRLLVPSSLPSSFSPPLQEQDMTKAWHDYAADFEEAPVGRGFYALQIYQWMKELRAFGRDPKHVLKVIRLEDLKLKSDNQQIPSRMLQEITDWLMLEGQSLYSSQAPTNETVDFSEGFRQRFETNYEKLGNPVLSRRTRQVLDAFYAPHNEMLGKLLGDKGWDYSARRQKEANANTTSSGTDSHQNTPMTWPSNTNPATSDGTFGPPYFLPSNFEDVIANDPCYHPPYSAMKPNKKKPAQG